MCASELPETQLRYIMSCGGRSVKVQGLTNPWSPLNKHKAGLWAGVTAAFCVCASWCCNCLPLQGISRGALVGSDNELVLVWCQLILQVSFVYSLWMTLYCLWKDKQLKLASCCSDTGLRWSRSFLSVILTIVIFS